MKKNSHWNSRIFRYIIIFFTGALICYTMKDLGLIQKVVSGPWQSELLSMDSTGRLTYYKDNHGFIIPDFSYAGYKGGATKLPEVPVVKVIKPQEGDNTLYIQSMIDSIGSLPPDSNGFKGALLLDAGLYEVSGTIRLRHSGVVLRGTGDKEDPLRNTIILAKGNTPEQRDVIVIGSDSLITGEKRIENTQRHIRTPQIDAGSFSFDLEDSSPFQVGDKIIIYHPCSENWLKAIDRGGVPAPSGNNPDERWTKNLLPITYNRSITAIDKNKITINAPVFYTLNRELSQSYVYKPDMTGLVDHVGLEKIRVDIETGGGEDENHAWQSVRIQSTENGWVKDCTLLHFGQSGIITEGVTHFTIEKCEAIDPVGKKIGERGYNFNTYLHSQLILFKDCYARNGRHHYVSNGTSSVSGIVFLRCVSDGSYEANEGHRMWTNGLLYDNLKEKNIRPYAGWRRFVYHSKFVLGLYNREDIGTGHGWGAVQSVCWNCDMDSSYGKIVLQKPPTAQNYAIGCKAKKITGKSFSSEYTPGYIEGQNKAGLEPVSLYEAQLNARM